MTQREWAADRLEILVAEYTRHGSFPPGTTAFDLGRALGRALTNSNESDYGAFIQSELFRVCCTIGNERKLDILCEPQKGALETIEARTSNLSLIELFELRTNLWTC